MTTPSFQKMATASASTKRNPEISGGKIAGPVTNLTGLAIVPLAPLTGEFIEKYKIESPRRGYVTYLEGTPDILVGQDLLTVDSVDYEILGAGKFALGSLIYYELVVETVRG